MSSDNPFLNRGKGNIHNRHGTISEEKLSKRLSATLTKASGAMDYDKSDMVTADFRIESKSTIHKTIAIKHGWLSKINQEAVETHKEPALCIQFVNEAGIVKPSGSWVMIPERLFKELLSHEID